MKKSTRIVAAIPAFVCTWITVACSNPAQGGGGGDPARRPSVPSRRCRSVELDAEKDYDPTSYTDGQASPAPAMRFDVPRTLSVTAGSAGHGSATLTITDEDRWSPVCTYRGDDDDDDRGFDCDQRARDSHYTLRDCDPRVRGDATATSLTLHVVDGDSHDPAHRTHVRVTLHEEDCQGAPPDAGAPDTGPPDTGLPDTGLPDTAPPDAGPPDTGPACDPTLCDDGNPCTVDSCAADGSCASTTASDGTWCSTGVTDVCLAPGSQTCTAGICGGGGEGTCGGLECSSTACDESSGACGSAPAGTPCSSRGDATGAANCAAGGTPATNVTPLGPRSVRRSWSSTALSNDPGPSADRNKAACTRAAPRGDGVLERRLRRQRVVRREHAEHRDQRAGNRPPRLLPGGPRLHAGGVYPDFTVNRSARLRRRQRRHRVQRRQDVCDGLGTCGP